jgi:hypothetical protein
MSTSVARLTFPPGELDDIAGLDYGTANDAQQAFISLSAPIQIGIMGFGTGKTTVGAYKTVALMMHNHNSLAIAVAPTYRHTETMFNAMVELLTLIHIRDGVNLVAHKKQSRGQAEIHLVNGSRCEFYSAVNLVSFFGKSVSTVWIDELEWADDPEGLLREVIHRLRERTKRGYNLIRRRHILVTSTAQYLTGVLRDKLEDAEEEQRRAEADPAYAVKLEACVAGSPSAIGKGLDEETVDLWFDQMDQSMFERVVLCDLSPPPEVIFGDYMTAATYPLGHIIDWKFVPEAKSFFLVDWGIEHSHWLFCQWSAVYNALVVVEEWGPDDGSANVGLCVKTMTQTAAKYRLVDSKYGRPVNRFSFECFGDPTANPGKNYKNVDEEHAQAQEGDRLLRALNWRYRVPLDRRQRSKHNQIQLVRLLLRPPLAAGARPRILFNRPLADDRNGYNAFKRARFGVYHSLAEGLKFLRGTDGRITEKIDKKSGWDHAFDCLAYGSVMIFKDDFDQLLHQEYGLLSGAAAWRR